MKIKNFNPDEETPEVIPDVKKESTTKNVLFKKSNVIVESSGSKLCYLIFGFQKVCEEYGIDYDECIVLMYLEELGLFKLQVQVFKRRVVLGDYLLKELIEEDYSHRKKKLYRLTKRGNDIVKGIYNTISDNSRLIGENRSVDLGLGNKVSSILSNYFR